MYADQWANGIIFRKKHHHGITGGIVTFAANCTVFLEVRMGQEKCGTAWIEVCVCIVNFCFEVCV